MNVTSAALLNAMSTHIGRKNGIRADALARALGCSARDLRSAISRSRFDDGIAICGTPRHGYYMAETPDELDETIAFLRQRAVHSLVCVSRMTKISLPDLLGQMKLNQT